MTDQRFAPKAINAPHGARELEIQWGDGARFRYPHRTLRGFCPCASCQGHSGSITFQTGGDLELGEIEPVGNYAIGLTWADRHNTGIYSFRYLRMLGEMLAEHGPEGLETIGRLPRA